MTSRLRRCAGNWGVRASARAPIEKQIEALLAAKRKIYASHPGFGREVFAYDTRRDTWRVVTRSPVAPQVTTFAVKWGEAVMIPSGEIRPGVRTPKVVRAVPTWNSDKLHPPR